jgi:hypothetical protein
MAKVYVSSTVADLKPERQAVMEWLVTAGHQPVHSYKPNSDSVRDSCLEDVDRCDLYVLIVGHRYGFQPAQDNPEGHSITQLEFRRAGQSGIPRIALLRTSIPDVSLSDMADLQRLALVSAFREEVGRKVRPVEFSDPQGLIQGLSTGIQAELDKLDKRDERQAVRGAGPASAADTSPGLARIADQLAIAVGAQWEAEARIRRLNDPYPLPVSWAAADASLIDTWDSLVKLAKTGAGWPKPPDAGSWAANSDDLAGEGGELAEVLARVPTGRLAVLGEPGAGKTMLMVRLVLDLLALRVTGGFVPILASVATWDPSSQRLKDWLVDRLSIDYPALAGPPPTNRTEATQAEALIKSKLILPILDGLDEIPEQVRGQAISRINDALQPGDQVVVTCRTQEYRDAVRPKEGVEVTLRAAAAIQLDRLDADTVRRYLLDDAAGPVTRARWEPVLAVLGTELPAGQALTTPLMVGLARAIYNPRPGELAGALPDPEKELCDPAFTAPKDVETKLFDAFIPAAYRHGPTSRWNALTAEKFLAFLARYLEFKTVGPDLAWWRLSLVFPGLALGLGVVIELIAGSALGLTGAVLAKDNMAGVVLWAVVGAVIGAIVGAVIEIRRSPRPARGIRWKLPGLSVIVIGIATAACAWGVAIVSRLNTVEYAIWFISQEGAPLDVSSASSPQAVLTRDRRAAILIGSGAAIGLCGAFALVTALIVFASGGELAVAAGTGAMMGAWAGIGVGAALALRASWPSYEVVRIWLALRRQLPWQLTDFLADAHRRGVLRQVGAVYQFRHIELQHRLANRTVDPD